MFKQAFLVAAVGISFMTGATWSHQTVHAEEGIALTPSFLKLDSGETANISIHNNTNLAMRYSVSAGAVKLGTADTSFLPLTKAEADTIGASNWVELNSNELSVAANSRQALEVKVRLRPEGVLPAVFIRELATGSEVVAATEFVVPILPHTLRASDYSELSTSLQTAPQLGIGGFSLGGQYTLTTTVSNFSNTFPQVSGEIRLLKGETRIDNLVLTAKLPNLLRPAKTARVESAYIDSRPFWAQLGRQKFQQTVTVDGKQFQSEQEVFVLPWQVLAITVLAVSLAIILLRRYQQRGRMR